MRITQREDSEKRPAVFTNCQASKAPSLTQPPSAPQVASCYLLTLLAQSSRATADAMHKDANTVPKPAQPEGWATYQSIDEHLGSLFTLVEGVYVC